MITANNNSISSLKTNKIVKQKGGSEIRNRPFYIIKIDYQILTRFSGSTYILSPFLISKAL